MKISESPEGNILIDTEGEPEATPPTDGNVRVPYFSGKWSFQRVGSDKIKLTYVLNVDPGGSLPSWIVNRFAAKGPLDTVSKLSRQLKQ